jgi:spermidine/putrescine-binding protein
MFIAAGCTRKEPMLTLLIRSDYLDPALVTDFQKRAQCGILLRTVSDDIELEMTLREGRIEADVIVASSCEIAMLQRQGFLSNLDPKRLPNRKNIDANFLDRFHLSMLPDVAVPYFVAPIGFVYQADSLPGGKRTDIKGGGVETLSWSILDELLPNGQKVASVATLLDEKRVAIGTALIACHRPLNSTDKDNLTLAGDKLKEWCEAGLRLNGKSYHYHLIADRNLISQARLEDVLPLAPEVHFAFPSERFIVTCDWLAIVSTTHQSDLAHRFIDYLCEANVRAQNMRWNLSWAPNKPASDTAKKDLHGPILQFLDADWANNGSMIQPLTPEQEELYDEICRKFESYRRF